MWADLQHAQAVDLHSLSVIKFRTHSDIKYPTFFHYVIHPAFPTPDLQLVLVGKIRSGSKTLFGKRCKPL